MTSTSDVTYDVGIVGAGFAGCALAIGLRQRGHRVTVYEAVANPGPVGAGILIQPTGQAVLEAFGLLDEVRARSAIVTELTCASGGRPIFRLPYADGDRGRDAVGFGLHRGVLFDVLYKPLAGLGVEVRTGVDVAAIEGRHVCDQAGRRYGPHELLVVADGARSHLRQQLFPMAVDRPYPFCALWFVAKDPEGTFEGRLHQQVRGARDMIGFLPTGVGPDGVGDGTPLVSFFYSVPTAEVAAIRARGLAAFQAETLQVAPQAESILAQLSSMDDLLFAGYRDVVLPVPYKDRVVVIGDAAHAMSPQLGQGSNLALVDALVLAACLSEAPNLMQAMDAFRRARAPHVRFYQFASRWLTPFFQSNASGLGTLRDVVFPWMTKLSYGRRRMVRVLTGYERGVLRAPMRTLDIP